MQILNIVLPVFLVIGIGYALGETKFITREINAGLSKIVFYIASPALLFRGALHSPVDFGRDLKIISAITMLTAIVAFVVYLLSRRTDPRRRGVLAQGAFRSNTVFVGLPIVTNAFGDAALGPAAVIIGFTVFIYIFASVIVLTLPHRNGQAMHLKTWLNTGFSVARNPLIVSTILGIVCAKLEIKIPSSIDQTLAMFASVAMPVALLSVGANLNLRQLRAELKPALVASFWKLIVYPAGVCLFLWCAGLRGPDLQIPVLIMAAPTAVLSYVMACEMNGDPKLASAIVIGTTVISPLSISAWLIFFAN